MIPVAEIPDRQLPPGHTVVEIGVGSHPFQPKPTVLHDIHFEPNPAWSFTEGRRYIGVDAGRPAPRYDPLAGRRRLEEFADRTRHRRRGEDISFIFGDATDPDLPIPKANELLMTNVLSSDLPDEEIERLLGSSERLLAPNGLLVVRETISPDLHPWGLLIPRLGDVGLSNVELVTPTDPAFEPLTNYYGPTLRDLSTQSGSVTPRSDRYFCFAQRA